MLFHLVNAVVDCANHRCSPREGAMLVRDKYACAQYAACYFRPQCSHERVTLNVKCTNVSANSAQHACAQHRISFCNKVTCVSISTHKCVNQTATQEDSCTCVGGKPFMRVLPFLVQKCLQRLDKLGNAQTKADKLALHHAGVQLTPLNHAYTYIAINNSKVNVGSRGLQRTHEASLLRRGRIC